MRPSRVPSWRGHVLSQLRTFAPLWASRWAVTAVVAMLLFVLAYDGGSYEEPSRDVLGIAVWWALLMGLAFRLLPRAPVPRAALVAGGLLGAFALWTLCSLAWVTSAEKAFAEFNRVSLYVALFALVVVTTSRGVAGRFADGAAIGVVAIAVVALGHRYFPDLPSIREFRTFLPSAYTRLSFPLGYWNGLAIFMGLGAPLLLRTAVVARSPLLRGFAVAPIPALVSVIYLASSRGGMATLLLGTFAFVLLSQRRVQATVAVAISAVGSAAAVAVLLDRRELVNGPLESAIAADQGRSAAWLLVAICLVTGAAHIAADMLLAGLRIAPSHERAAAFAVAAVALVAIIIADPVARFDAFRQPPTALAAPEDDFVRAHLLSGNGSGRWQFWETAIDQWLDRPLYGHGAGSYEAWWTQNGTLGMFIRDAHSLYVEVLGELGIVGFLLIGGALGTGVVAGAMRLRRAREEDEAVTLAALLASFVAFVVAAGVDWIWEMTVTTLLGIVFLALLTGPATNIPERLRSAAVGDRPRRATRYKIGAGVAVLLVGWLAMIAHAIPLFARNQIRASEKAASRGEIATAFERADDARNLQPWAASPYLQLALVAERAGQDDPALRYVRAALERDSKDWRLWLVAARLETKLRRVAEARRSLENAERLNPRSPLFAER